jgi:hypothetical protein
MSFRSLDQNEISEAAKRLFNVANNLNKSFSAGAPGVANADRTGLASFAIADLSNKMESLTIQEEDFILSKDLKTVNAKQTVYEYNVRTSAGTDLDGVWGTENFQMAESAGNYIRTFELLKVMGVRKSITHQAQIVNDLGGYSQDLNQLQEEEALLTLGEALERALYHGGDGFIDASGAINNLIAADPNGPTRVIRGLQAQIREGNLDPRGINKDFRGYANNRSTVIDAKGSTLTRPLLDKIVTAVNGNRGKIEEAHGTPEQMRLFRASLFPVDRGVIGASYAVRGSDIQTEHKSGFSVDTTNGAVLLRSSLFKNERVYLAPSQSSMGVAAPNPPALALSSQSAGSTSYKAGDVVRYIVQSCSKDGRSFQSSELAVTIAADGNNVVLSITPAANFTVEFYQVYRLNPGEVFALNSDGLPNHKFIGRIVAARQGATLFVDAQAILPGFNAAVFLPKADKRAELAVLGPRISRIDYGIKGLAQEFGYVSYLACILKLPRQHGMLSNVLEEFEV